jgi:zinc protease
MDEAELKSSKDAMVNSLPGAFETTSEAVGNFSNTYIYNLGLDYYTHYAASVNAVSTEAAMAMVKKYLGQDRLVVIAVGDRAKIEPELKKLNLGTVEIRDAEGKPIS